MVHFIHVIFHPGKENYQFDQFWNLEKNVTSYERFHPQLVYVGHDFSELFLYISELFPTLLFIALKTFTELLGDFTELFVDFTELFADFTELFSP